MTATTARKGAYRRHPDDDHANQAILARLRAARVAAGLGTFAVDRAIGVAQSSTWLIEHSHNPMISTLQRYARILGRELTLTPAGLRIDGGDPDVAILAAVHAATVDPAKRDALHIQWYAAVLRAARIQARVKTRVVAGRVGVRWCRIAEWERAEKDPLLATYQAWTRALGGVLVPELKTIEGDQ